MPKLKVHDRFRYNKNSFLHPGDKFRASGGPVYVGIDDTGKEVRHPMGERGVFVFRQYCEMGASKWIEATGGQRRVIIYVGSDRRSPRVDGLRLRPHKIRPVYSKRQEPLAIAQIQKQLF